MQNQTLIMIILYQIWNQVVFFFSANKYSTKEVIHSLKIISDNKYDKIDFNNTKNIDRIFEKNFDQIIDFVNDIKGFMGKKI